jgi:probable blue pigment (indigoidine) exporter
MPTHTRPSLPDAPAVVPLVAATACWGVGTVVTKQVLDDIAPLTLLPLQLTASSVLLLAVALAQRTPLASTTFRTPPIRRLAALGVLNPGLAYALGLLGLTTITASLSVLLWAAEPVLILALAVVLLRDRVPVALAATLIVAVAGVLLVVYQPGASGEPVGVALTLTAVGCCALYTVLTRRLMLDDSSLIVVLAQQVAALGFAVVLATAVELTGGAGWEVDGLDTEALVGAVASGILYYGLAFWFYLAGLRRTPASVAGAFLPLIPVFGVAAGYLAGERLAGRQWLGAGIVVVATLSIAWQQRTRTAPEPHSAPSQ